jgi:hypothetical protein
MSHISLSLSQTRISFHKLIADLRHPQWPMKRKSKQNFSRSCIFLISKRRKSQTGMRKSISSLIQTKWSKMFLMRQAPKSFNFMSSKQMRSEMLTSSRMTSTWNLKNSLITRGLIYKTKMIQRRKRRNRLPPILCLRLSH